MPRIGEVNGVILKRKTMIIGCIKSIPLFNTNNGKIGCSIGQRLIRQLLVKVWQIEYTEMDVSIYNRSQSCV
jgi:hypothetical protein